MYKYNINTYKIVSWDFYDFQIICLLNNDLTLFNY